MKAESLSFGIVVIIKRENIKMKHRHILHLIHNNLIAKTKLRVYYQRTESILTLSKRVCFKNLKTFSN